LALSGGYADDVDLGHEFTYTGSGGKKLSGLVNGKFLNLRTAPQTYDQSFEDSFNAALRTSSKTRKPIRVIRGYKLDSQWAPLEGYLYCGLYVCTRAWMGDGLSGHKVCKYAFKRLPNQDPLPIPDREGESEEQVTDDTSVEEDGLEKIRKSHSLQYQSKGLIVEVVINTNDNFSPYNSLSSVSPLK
jgi:E3 ubiquitin-protein ligase UHRF1